MEYNIKAAFKVPFAEEGWFFKSLHFGSLGSSVFVLNIYRHHYWICGVLSTIIFFVYFGYGLQFIHNVIHSEKPFLPDWKNNIKKYTKYGFIGYFTIIVTILLLDYIAMFLLHLIGIQINQIKSILNTKSLYLFVIGSIIWGFLLCLYADRFESMDILSPIKLVKLFWIAKKEVLLSTLLIISLFVLCIVIGFIMMITIIGLPFIPNFIGMASFIILGIVARTYSVAICRFEKKKTELQIN